MKFVNGVIQSQNKNETALETYLRATTALYDSNVPLTKPIGFYLESSGISSSKQLDRNKSVMENMIQLSSNLSKIVFQPFRPLAPRASHKFAYVTLTADREEIVTTSTTKFKSQQNPVNVINKKLHVLSAIDNVTLTMIAIDYTGYVSMEQSAKLIEQAVKGLERDFEMFFPMSVDFSLLDYVKILPPVDPTKPVRYRLENGMTDELLNIYWERGLKYNAEI